MKKYEKITLIITSILIILFTIIFNKDEEVLDNNEIKEEQKEIIIPEEIIIEEDKKVELIKEEPKKTETKKIEPKKQETKKEKTTPIVEYTCPEGYTLNNTKCLHTEPAYLGCPTNYHESSDGTISGCITFSEGYNTEDECPSNQIKIKMITLDGTPSKYECYPVHPKEYICNEGYTKNNANTCTITIDATKK